MKKKLILFSTYEELIREVMSCIFETPCITSEIIIFQIRIIIKVRLKNAVTCDRYCNSRKISVAFCNFGISLCDVAYQNTEHGTRNVGVLKRKR
jgi:hypothetical protein